MVPTTRQDIKAFQETAEAAGLKDGTVKTLIDQDIDSTDVVALLQPDDVNSLGLSRGQALLITRWVSTFSKPSPPPSVDAASDEAQSTSQAVGPCWASWTAPLPTRTYHRQLLTSNRVSPTMPLIMLTGCTSVQTM